MKNIANVSEKLFWNTLNMPFRVNSRKIISFKVTFSLPSTWLFKLPNNLHHSTVLFKTGYPSSREFNRQWKLITRLKFQPDQNKWNFKAKDTIFTIQSIYYTLLILITYLWNSSIKVLVSVLKIKLTISVEVRSVFKNNKLVILRKKAYFR